MSIIRSAARIRPAMSIIHGTRPALGPRFPCFLQSIEHNRLFSSLSHRPRRSPLPNFSAPNPRRFSVVKGFSSSLSRSIGRDRSLFGVHDLSTMVSLIGRSVIGECFCRVRFGDFRSARGIMTVGHTPQLHCAEESQGATGVMNNQNALRRATRGRDTAGSERSDRKLSHNGATFAEDSREGPLTDLEKEKFQGVSVEATNKFLTLPTILTLARVAAVPAILAVFYCNEPWATAAGASIFVLAAVTDWLDGYLARKMGSSSAFGAFLDPVADKLMVAAALVLLCTKPLAFTDLASVPWLLPLPTIAIIGREITMSAVREWAATQGGDLHKAVAVNNLGKIKTASQMIAITLLLASGEGGLDPRLAVVGVALLYVAAFLALWSLAMYMKGIWGSMFK